MSGISPQDFPPEWEEIDEEIDLAEIESTVAQLQVMIDATKSETIKSYLQAALEDTANLAEWEEVDEDDTQAEAA